MEPHRQQKQASPKRRRDESGVAMMIALAMIAILGVLVFEYMFATRVEINIASGFRDRLCAYYAARSGMHYALDALKQDEAGSDSLHDSWAQPMQINVGESKTTITIEDEDRRLCVNSLVQKNTQVNENLKEWLILLVDNQNYFEVEGEDLVEAVIDWIDENDDGEVETDYYEDLEEPYRCANRPLLSIYELRFVRDITDQVFFGMAKPPEFPIASSEWEEDQLMYLEEEREEGLHSSEYTATNLYLKEVEERDDDYEYTEPEDYEYTVDEENEGQFFGLVNFLTAYPNSGAGHINMNTAHPELLRAIFDDDMSIVDGIMQARIEQPFENIAAVKEVVDSFDPALYNKAQSLISVKSEYFKISSVGQYRKSKVMVTAIYKRSDLQKKSRPLYWRVENIE
jgi:type II secretory pathway component PulK